MENVYPKAYKEVYEILKFMPKESVEKIPLEMRLLFERKLDINYDFEINEDKPFEEQQLLLETKAILANLYRDYWAENEEREKILQKEKEEIIKIEEEKRQKYNPDDLFKNKQKTKIISNENNLPMEIKKENFFKRFIKFIKSFLNI